MNSEQIMKSDVLDILFEKRNKLYGAYNLRKFYNNRLMKSIAGMLGMLLVFISFSFIETSNKDSESPMLVKDFEMAQADVIKKAPEVKPMPKSFSKPVSMDKFSGSVVIVNAIDSADKLPTLRDNALIGNTTTTAPADDGPLVGNTDIHGDGGTSPAVTTATEPLVDVTVPIENPEVAPVFPGGMEALRKFLQKNLANPREMEEGEMVSVKMKFVVGFDGKLQRFETIQDGGAEFNNEVLRVFKKMPEWIPGKSKGRNVAVYYVIPIKFVSEK